MIHTDGTPTIANAPRRSVDTVDTGSDIGVSLLERDYAGLNVQVRWVEGTEHLLLCVERGDERHSAVIDGKDAHDAFQHPYVYLAAKGVEYRA